ncbi:DMT family transporter [Dyadobacter subterraneus]|uniref:EamA family transporter n=1 Tax=Dyadobacter subterraneus TaxID=2773304 RepID=A0ABR9W9Q6_9BACT|nr:DMT family transporter [Dyadobacter subterraneus]MBE9462138.1 EamA family transporter [Dyadobacter subterraneus]
MSLSVLSLVLTAAVLHACWNLLAKKTKGKTPFIWLIYLGSTVIYSPVLFMKIQNSDFVFTEQLFWFSLSSAVLHVGYNIFLQKGYRSADLSVVYALARGSGPLFASVAAILFLHEPLKWPSAAGLVLIIAGVLVITRLKLRTQLDKQIITGLIYGTFTGLFIAAYTFNDAIGIKSYKLSPVLLTFCTNCFGVILLFPFIVKQKAQLKTEFKLHGWIIAGISLLSPAAYILVLEALKYAPLTVVAPARELSIVLGVWVSSKVFSESDTRRRILGSILILAGILALSLS